MYFDYIEEDVLTYPGAGNVHGVYLVDTEGTATALTPDNKNLFLTEVTFVKGTTANILPALYSAGEQVRVGVTIIDGGAFYDPTRVPNENYVLIADIPEYTNPGFLIPFNFNPKYNIYDLAKKAGLL